MGSYEANTKYTYKYLIRNDYGNIVHICCSTGKLYSLFYKLFSHKYFRNLRKVSIVNQCLVVESTFAVVLWWIPVLLSWVGSEVHLLVSFRRWSFLIFCHKWPISKILKKAAVSMQRLWVLSWSDCRPMAFLVPAKIKKQKPYWERKSEKEGRKGKQSFITRSNASSNPAPSVYWFW